MTAPTPAGGAVDPGPRISTPDRRLRIFVSSTLQELAPERRAVRAAVVQLRLTPVMFELGARPYPPRELYRAYLAQSDVFVGIYGGSYGWVAPGEQLSGLEDEYVLSGLRPKLIYVKTGVQREPRLEQLLDRVRDDDRASYKSFTDAAELADLLLDDLAVLMTERFTLPTPPTADGDLRRGRLPVPPTRLVGRSAEVAEVVALLADPAVRLVSLVGPGGIGKTRVVVQVATEVAEQGPAGPAPDGVWFVDLAPVTSPGRVVEVLAGALGVRVEGTRPLLEVLVDRLATVRALLVLDNFEQVLAAAGDVATLLAGAPGVTVLTSTRAVLGLRGERPVPLDPLALPGGTGPVAQAAAVELFVERAQQTRPGFRLTEANADDVAELCRLLEGIPLALELAAAQLRVLSLSALLRRLTERIDRSLDLEMPAADAPSRQHTLRQTLEWSTGLLDGAQQALFARLSVFAQTWTLEAAEAVGSGARELDVLDELSALVGHSLVTLVDPDDDEEMRFRMLAYVRGFARDQLAARGEEDATRDRLAAYLVQFALAAGAGSLGADNRRWVGELDAAVVDLRAAMERAITRDDAETAVRLAAPLFAYWWNRGLLAAMDEIAERAAALPSADRLTPHLANLLLWARGMFRISRGDLADAEPMLARLRQQTTDAGDDRLRAGSLAGLGLAAVGTPLAERRAMLEEAVGDLRRLGDRWGLTFALSVSGQLALQGGEPAEASRIHTEALAIARSIDQEPLEAQLLDLLALDALAGFDLPAARSHLVEGAALHRRLADVEGSANALGPFAAVLLAQGHPYVAAQLLAAAARSRERIGATVWPGLVPTLAALSSRVGLALGPEDDARARREGRELSAAAALQLAVESVSPDDADRTGGPAGSRAGG